jgi:hypothetical protein
MFMRASVWLTPTELQKKYPRFCTIHDFTDKFLSKLCDAHLLVWRKNYTTKKIEITEESFMEILNLIRYNFEFENLSPTSQVFPHYSLVTKKIIESKKTEKWFTPTELLKEIPINEVNKTYNAHFILTLVYKRILFGRINTTDIEGNYVNLTSFLLLLEYHNYILTKQHFTLPNKDLL